MTYHPENDLYEVLGVPPDAPPDEIRAALQGRAELIIEAQDVLLDEAKRRDYDRARSAYIENREARRRAGSRTPAERGSSDLWGLALGALALAGLVWVIARR